MSQSPHVSPFDAIRKVDEHGNEYWSARELYKILGYTEWRNFNNVVIKRATKACEENGRAVADHFVRSYKMVAAVRLSAMIAPSRLETLACTYLVPGTRYCPGKCAEYASPLSYSTCFMHLPG